MEWGSALARALTGQDLSLPETGPVAARVLELLAELGWDADRIQHRAAERAEAGLVWPEPPDPDWCRQVGPARWLAVLTSAQHQLEHPELPPAPRPLTADERRLLADVPPHW